MGVVPVGYNSIIDLKDVPCEEVDMGEKNILDVVVEKLGKMSKNEIINFMHKEQAYVETAPREYYSVQIC